MLIFHSDLSIVIQGFLLDNDTYKDCINSYRKVFKDAEIILSTWEGTNVDGLDVDKVVFSPDPGPLVDPESAIDTKPNNLNRQIVSSKAGIEITSKPYVIKTRTDIKIFGDEILGYYNNENTEVFKNIGKFVIGNSFAKNPNQIYPSPFHFSDWIIFSDQKSMRELFNVAMLTNDNNRLLEPSLEILKIYKKYDTEKLKYSAETYIWFQYLRKYIDLSYDHLFDNNKRNKIIQNILLACHFVILNNKQLKISHMKNEYKRVGIWLSPLNYTHTEWNVNRKHIMGYQANMLEYIMCFIVKNLKIVIWRYQLIKLFIRRIIGLKDGEPFISFFNKFVSK